MLTIGVITLVMSILTYICCLLVFGGLSEEPMWRKFVFAGFIVKAFTWSPFMGHEMYDALFEQIYHDVEF